jgi:hypothetical protein
MKTSKIKILGFGSYFDPPQTGDFSTANNKYGGVRWYYCRDMFKRAKSKNWLFCHEKGQSETIFSFMRDLENTLELKQKSVVERTKNLRVTLIKLSDFWTKHLLRKSFLSAALRAARNYNGNLKETLFNLHYFNNKEAVELFLKGYVNFPEKWRRSSVDWIHEGWTNYFSGREAKNIMLRN